MYDVELRQTAKVAVQPYATMFPNHGTSKLTSPVRE